MGKAVGSEPLGSLYSAGKVRRRREWRGLRDTMYDYFRWLGILGVLLRFIAKPRNFRGFLRYRWMVNYLAVPMMMDRVTEGLRGPHLRIAHLEYGLIIREIAETLGKLFRGDRRIGNDRAFSDRVVLLDENEMTAIMMGFPTLEGLSREIPTLYVANLLRQDSAEHYLDVVQEFGLPGDVCPMPATEAGISIDDDYCVLGKCAVQCNTTCDGSLMGNSVISKRLELEDGIPCFQLAMPLRHTREDVQEYAAQEIRSAIAFIEEQTGAKWDWDYYFTCAKRVNETTRHRLEWLDINKTPYPQFLGLNLAVYTETNYLGVCGKSELFVKNDRKIAKIAEKAYRDKAMYVKEYRHRAIVWGVQSQFYFEMLLWLENCWGILPLTDMLSMLSTRILSEDDKEQAIYDMAWLTENMIMRNRTHGGYAVLLDQLWEYCQEFNADTVILWEHMSCKSLTGLHGQFEEKARQLGIHLIWVSHDLCDPRNMSKQGIRDQINKYMRTVFREEPLDPSLEILPDGNSW